MANCEDISWSRAISVLNREFENDVTLLHKAPLMYNDLVKSKITLEKQLSFATSEAPSKIEKAVKEGESKASQIKAFTEETELLCGDVDNHKADVTSLVKNLSALTNQMKEVERYSKYLQVISRIEDFSADVQSALLVNSVERAVAQFFELAELAERLQGSSQKNLVHYANETVLFWYNILKEKFSSELDEVLRAWRWPFIVSTTKTSPIQNAAEIQEKLGPLFVNLLHLQLPDGLTDLVQVSDPFLSNLPGWSPLLLPVQLMIKPLSRRFKYHFYGSKQTNSLDKPEWYLSQILGWIRDHREFLRTKIQPLLEQEGLGYVDIVVEFSRGLTALAIEKLLSDIPELMYDDHIFSHMVDEVLAFDIELVKAYNYPNNQHGCLHVLIQPQPFEKWIAIEKKFAQEKLDAMFSSATAWQSQYKDLSEVDDLKVPECGESFMTLMLTITERYKSLPTPQHRLEFLDFQLELLEDFRYRLSQIKTDVGQEPLGQRYAAILNTVNSITEVLKQWSEDIFFIQLQYFKNVQSDSFEDQQKENPSSLDNSLQNSPVKQSQSVMSFEDCIDSQLEALDGCVFDEIIGLLERMKIEMIINIVYYVADDVKARTRAYRNDKWVGMPASKDLTSPALSTTACEMMLVLRERLQHVEQLLSKDLFTILWQKVAEILNSFFYQEVILANSFNEGGAFQIHFDMVRNLFPLFGQYTQKPDSYFKDVKEACQVLTMNVGSALLLKDVLYCALHDPKSDPNDMPSDPVLALHEQAIYKLMPEDVELLLRRRLDLVAG